MPRHFWEGMAAPRPCMARAARSVPPDDRAASSLAGWLAAPPARCSRSSRYDPHRWVAAARRAGADAQPAGDDVDPELPALQLVGDDPAAGRRLSQPGGDPDFQTIGAGPVAEQDAGFGLGHRCAAVTRVESAGNHPSKSAPPAAPRLWRYAGGGSPAVRPSSARLAHPDRCDRPA